MPKNAASRLVYCSSIPECATEIKRLTVGETGTDHKKRKNLALLSIFRLQEGITTVCKAYEDFYKNRLPIPTNFLRRMLCLILKENSFQFNQRHYLQTHGTAMGTKMAVAFANIFMAKIEKGIISKSIIKPLVWKRYIDDVFCLWDTNEDNIKEFVTRANHYHDTIKFTA